MWKGYAFEDCIGMQLSESILHYQRNACYAAVQQLIAVTTTTYNMCDIEGAIIAK